MRRFAFATLALFCASPTFAQTAQEALQEQLVDSVNRTEQEITRAVDAFNAGDTAGGCNNLRAAAGDTTASIAMAQQIAGLIRLDTSLSEETRGQMLSEITDMHGAFVAQKQRMDAQIASRCS